MIIQHNIFSLLLVTLTLPCLGMHNQNNLPTFGRNRVAPEPVDAKKLAAHRAQEQRQFAWPTAAPDSAEDDEQTAHQKERKLAVNYAQLIDDAVFAATGFSKEIQQIIKEYNRPSISLMPAFMSRKIINEAARNILLLSDKYFATARNEIVTIYDINTGARVRELVHPGHVRKMFSTPDGLLVCVTSNYHFYTWQFHTGELIHRMGMLYDSVQIDQLKNNLAIAHNKKIVFWDIRAGKALKSVNVPDGIACLKSLEDELLILTRNDILMLWHPENGLRTLAASSITDEITPVKGGLIIEEFHTKICSRFALPSKQKNGNLLRFYDLTHNQFLENATTFVEAKWFIKNWNASTQQFELITPDASRGEIGEIREIDNSHFLLSYDATSNDSHGKSGYHSLYLYNTLQKRYLRMFLNCSISCATMSSDNSIMLISFANHSLIMEQHKTPIPSLAYRWQAGTAIITQQEDALQALHSLSVVQQLALEKFITQLDKQGGVASLFDDNRPLSGNMHQQFMALPAPIRRCLKSWYNITETPTKEGGSLCVIS